MDDHHDDLFEDKSRRRFLQAAALAVAGAATAAVGPGTPILSGQEAQKPSPASGDCDCSIDGAVPVLAAAVVSGKYAALASTAEGPRLFSLSVNADHGVALAAPLPVTTPRGFKPGTLGVARGRFLLAGGVPKPWRSYQVDDRPDPIQVFGVAPAAFLFDGALIDAIALPDTSAEVFATVGGVGETSHGTIVIMIEHSGGEPESWYAAAVDVFEEVPGGWELRASARDLGESGPNHLVVKGDAIGVELTTSRGVKVAGADTAAARLAVRDVAADVLGSDELVTVVPVAGAPEQVIAIGRRSARIVEVAHVL
jgi:hypothetical protein